MRLADDFYDTINAEPCVFIHRGNNGRNGSIMVFRQMTKPSGGRKPMAEFYEVCCASKDQNYTVNDRKKCRYAIGNFERDLPVMRGDEAFYHEPILERVKLGHAGLPANPIVHQALYLYDAAREEREQSRTERSATEGCDTEQLTQTKGKHTMNINLKTAAAIVDETVTTIRVKVKLRDAISKELTFLCDAALAATLSPDCFVLVGSDPDHIVPFNVGVVIRVDAEPDVELNTDLTYRWAFQKVDHKVLERLMTRQERVHTMLKEKQRSTTRASIIASLGLTADDIKLID